MNYHVHWNIIGGHFVKPMDHLLYILDFAVPFDKVIVFLSGWGQLFSILFLELLKPLHHLLGQFGICKELEDGRLIFDDRSMDR